MWAISLPHWFCCFCGVYFIINDLIYSTDWNIIMLNGRSIIMTFLFDWMSLLFIWFIFIISSLVILYDDDDHMFGDLNIIRFILLVLIFVVSTIFLIVSPNVISTLLGWDGLCLVSCWFVIYYQISCFTVTYHSRSSRTQGQPIYHT